MKRPTTANRGRLLPALAAALIGLTGCGSSDDQKLQAEVQKVQKGEMTVIDNAKFRKITDKGLACLENANKLQWLTLDDSLITDEGLKHLTGLSSLTGLSLTGTRVTNAGLEPLTELNMLDYLRLDWMRVKDAGLETIAKIPRLRELTLWGCVITDRGMPTVAKMENLERLAIEKTLVSDAGILQLRVHAPFEIPGRAGNQSHGRWVERTEKVAAGFGNRSLDAAPSA